MLVLEYCTTYSACVTKEKCDTESSYAVAIAYVTASGLSRSCGTSERLYLISYSSTVQVCCQ